MEEGKRSNIRMLNAGAQRQAEEAKPSSQYLLSPFVLQGASPLIQQGILAVDFEDGRIRLRDMRAVQPLAMDFIVVRMDRSWQCWWRHNVLNQQWGIIPQDCLRCWKVVARPKNLGDLLEVYQYQLKTVEDNCKCGAETRAYVRGIWGAYWYHEDQDSGIDTFERLCNDFAHLDMEIYLKRGCTEYEMQHGDSQSWDEVSRAQKMDEKELAIRKYLDMVNLPNVTPDVFIAPIFEGWYRHATKYGQYTPDNFGIQRGIGEVKCRRYRDRPLDKGRPLMGPRGNA